MNIFILVCTVCNFSDIWTGNECKTKLETFQEKPLLIERLKQEPLNLSGPQCRVFEGKELFYEVSVQRKLSEKVVTEMIETGRTVELKP